MIEIPTVRKFQGKSSFPQHSDEGGGFIRPRRRRRTAQQFFDIRMVIRTLRI